ncbi:MAG: C40 family peptidase [Lachnospiraceae bacterium]|nr:C40 family peptidase [Lachnospiraceae bacterium]
MLEFLKEKKNMILAGVVSLICIAFVISAVRSDYETVPVAETVEEQSTDAEPETLIEAEELTATASDYLARKEERIFSKPASNLKELQQDDTEYVPASYRLNLAYYYPEGADTSDSIHSYAGEIFQTLNTLNADYLANYYDMSDTTPLSFAQRRGQGKARVTGKYNPNDSRHDPKDPSTWTINSFRNVNVTFYDGDGNHINGYYVVQEIMSMANVYAYYHDMDDAEAMELYCRTLFENAMSSRVSMGNVYYDSGCLKRTKQDEAAEAIAMEIEQLTTEHQLSGATARSSGYEALANYLATSAADENGTSDEDTDEETDDSAEESSDESSTVGEGYASYGTGLTGSTSSHESRLESIDSNVVVSGGQGSGISETNAAGIDLSGYAVVGGSNTSSTAVYSGGSSVTTSEAVSDPSAGSGTAVVNSDGTAGGSGSSDVVTSEGTSIQDVPAETAGDDSYVDSGSSDDGYVVSPASSLFDIRRIFSIIKHRTLKPVSMSLFPTVYRLAEENYVVSPGQGTSVPSETAAPETAAAEVIQDAPAEPAAETTAAAETAAPASDSSNSSSGSGSSGSAGSTSVGQGGSRQPVTNSTSSSHTEPMSEEDAAIAAQIDELLRQANVLSGSEQYCPGHIDLYISITIKGIDDKNGLFKADKIGNDPANFNNRWQGWTTDKIAEARALNHQDWFETYGLSISSINLTSQLTEEEIQEYLAGLPSDVSDARKAVVDFALHSVGKVPYYWGGKPNGPGYDGNNFYTLVGADTSGRILRGLDCSGWVNWVYWSATGKSLAGESTGTLIGCGKRITRSALKPGDIIIRTGADSHVVMFLGWVGNGNFIGIHETGGVKNNVVVGEMTASWPYYRSLID